MKISWHSNAPWAKTGYGQQTALFAPRLKALGHDVAIQAFYGLEGGVLMWNGLPVYPRAYHQYGQDTIAAHSQHYRADITISLLDAWVYEAENPEYNFGSMRWCPWFPVDMEPIPPPVARKASAAYQGIVYSKFAQRQAASVGLDVRYVPHGVDTKVFKPVTRKAAREALKVDDGAYIVGMVAANKGTPSRKAFEPQLRAFANFLRTHPNAVLYLHTVADERQGGVNLRELCAFLGLQEKRDVIFCDQYANVLGFPDEYMVNAYGAMDVLLSVTMGEGFGVPILEAQACGVPVIVGDWTAMSELCWYGVKVPKAGAEKWWTPLASYQFMPRAEAVEDALYEAYRTCNLRFRPAEVDGYDADHVTAHHWKPVLDELAARVEAEKGEAVTA